MEYLALAIFASTVLVLVDRNRKWAIFWKACAVLVLLGVATVGFMFWQDHRAEAAQVQAKKQAAAIAEKCAHAGDVIDQVACEQTSQGK